VKGNRDRGRDCELGTADSGGLEMPETSSSRDCLTTRASRARRCPYLNLGQTGHILGKTRIDLGYPWGCGCDGRRWRLHTMNPRKAKVLEEPLDL
jgi:hypothetical protein